MGLPEPRGEAAGRVDDAPLHEPPRVWLVAGGAGAHDRLGAFLRAAGAVIVAADAAPDLAVVDGCGADDGATGLAALAALRRRDPDLPILLVVPPWATGGAARAERALTNGASDAIAAPIEPAELAFRLRNVSAAQRLGARLQQLDPLTGLARREAFLARVERLIQSDPVQRRTLLVLNLDRFKPVNASLGHAAGDTLLRALAVRLGEVVARHGGAERRGASLPDTRPESPWVARLDSDGFAVLLPGGRGDTPLEAALAELGTRLAEAYPVAGRDLVVPASVGLATWPDDARSVAELLQRATQAMEYAKRRGGRRMVWFDGVVERRATDRLLTEQQLRHAIDAGELRLWYQPKVDCATLALVGVEALVRWQHPDRGLLGPQWFIPVAEASGLIVELGAWVAREACRQGQSWRAAGLPALDIAINVSAGQMRRGDLVATIRDALATSGYPANRLTLEITESVLIADDDSTARMIEALRATGVALSLDDFGTGYASMTMLRRFAFDEIKIDRSFVRGLPGHRDGSAITRAIACLASDLGLKVVAEGIESTAELQFLRGFPGCRFQGDLFSKPIDAAAMTALLAAGAGTHGSPG